MWTRLSLLLLLLATIPTLGCQTPVGVSLKDPRAVHRSLTRNVLTAEQLGGATQIVLQRLDLDLLYRSDPDEAISRLHALGASSGDAEMPLAPAETSFLRAERQNRRSHYRAAAVYAYLFPEGGFEPPSRFDPSFRLACDLYNREITSGFASEVRGEVLPKAGLYELPFRWLAMSFDSAQLRWANRPSTRSSPSRS